MGRRNKIGKVIWDTKKRFTIKLILVALDLDKKIRIDVDVLDYVTGGVLLIECVYGR